MFNNLHELKPIYFFLLYLFVRAYFFRRKNGAPIAARRIFLPITIYVGFILRNVFVIPLWIVIVPFIIALIYSIKGTYDIKKGKLKPDSKNIKYDKFLLETFIVFILSFVVIKLIGMDYFLKGF